MDLPAVPNYKKWRNQRREVIIKKVGEINKLIEETPSLRINMTVSMEGLEMWQINSIIEHYNSTDWGSDFAKRGSSKTKTGQVIQHIKFNKD